jgi:hypothetical protein
MTPGSDRRCSGPLRVASLLVGVALVPSCSLRDLHYLDSETGPADGASGGISFVQVRSSLVGPVATASLSFDSDVGAHHAIVVAFDFKYANETGQVLSKITDTLGSDYTTIIGDIEGNTMTSYLAVALDTRSGPDTVTVTLAKPSAGEFHVAVLEYAGIALTDALDATSYMSGRTSGTDSMSSGSATTHAASELIFGFGDTGITTTPRVVHAGTGFSAHVDPHGDATTDNVTEDRVVTMAGSVSAQASMVSGLDWTMFMATFRGQ